MTTLTILEAVDGRNQSKTFKQVPNAKGPGSRLQVVPYSRTVWFNAKQEPVSDIDQLYAVLGTLANSPKKLVVRGAPRENVAHTRMRRTKYNLQTKTGNILDVDQFWVMLDIDKFPLDLIGFKYEDIKLKTFNWDGLVTALMQYLPDVFKSSTYIYQISASQNVKKSETVSMHLWFWFDVEASNKELKDYFGNINSVIADKNGVQIFIDLALFNAVQVHYTADPIFINMNDPVNAPRLKLIRGKQDAVPISKTHIKDDPQVSGRFLARLQELGGADGFNAVLHTAAWTFVSEFGDGADARKQFCDAAQAQIAATDKGQRSDEEIGRYSSNDYLNKILQSAVDKGAGKGAVSGAAIQFFERFYYLADLGEFYDLSTKRVVKEKSFDALAQSKLKIKGAVGIFLQEMSERVVNGEVYYPDVQLEPLKPFIFENNEPYLNTWTGRSCHAASEHSSAIDEHLSYICDGNELVTKQLSQFLAHTLRYPGEKIAWAPLLISDYNGVGKTMLSMLYTSVGDRKSMKLFDGEQITGNFNDYAYGQEITFIDEIEQAHKSKSVGGYLKSLIGTDEYIQLNEKGIRRRTVPNRVNYILTSNRRDAVSLDKEARRYLVILCEAHPKSQDYYTKLVKVFKDGEHILSWAESVDLSQFNRHARPTRTKMQEHIEESSLGSWRILLTNALLDFSYPMHRSVFTVGDLLYTLNGEYNITISRHDLAKFLREKGFKIRDQIKIGEKRSSVWVRNTKELTRAPNTAISELYQPIEKKSHWDILKGSEKDD